MEGNITLIHNENHIEVDKQKLASKSCYFASLFSHNFNDSHNKEYIINYNIAFSTLQVLTTFFGTMSLMRFLCIIFTVNLLLLEFRRMDSGWRGPYIFAV